MVRRQAGRPQREGWCDRDPRARGRRARRLRRRASDVTSAIAERLAGVRDVVGQIGSGLGRVPEPVVVPVPARTTRPVRRAT